MMTRHPGRDEMVETIESTTDAFLDRLDDVAHLDTQDLAESIMAAIERLQGGPW